MVAKLESIKKDMLIFQENECSTWINDKLPATILICCFIVSIRPKLACVDNLEAKVISKFPFKPNNAGTNIYTSGISW